MKWSNLFPTLMKVGLVDDIIRNLSFTEFNNNLTNCPWLLCFGVFKSPPIIADSSPIKLDILVRSAIISSLKELQLAVDVQRKNKQLPTFSSL